MFASTSKLLLLMHPSHPLYGIGLTLSRSPLIIYNSVVDNAERLANIKNFTLFEQDLANNALPQWMFITPNMSKSLSL